ncbi:hypothetical protein FRC17_002298 [Serendipita sp. 399]|nr:hypothetical protein FRC17_002298 [Serendipita sp. 399]
MASTSMPMPTSTSTTTPTIHIPPSVLDTLIDVFWNMLVSKWIAAAGLVAMLYDIVLTLEDEIEVIWKKKKVLSSVLYLAVSTITTATPWWSSTFLRGWTITL